MFTKETHTPSEKIDRLLKLTYSEERMSRLSKEYMTEVAGEQRSLETHQAAKRRTEATLRKNLGKGIQAK